MRFLKLLRHLLVGTSEGSVAQPILILLFIFLYLHFFILIVFKVNTKRMLLLHACWRSWVGHFIGILKILRFSKVSSISRLLCWVNKDSRLIRGWDGAPHSVRRRLSGKLDVFEEAVISLLQHCLVESLLLASKLGVGICHKRWAWDSLLPWTLLWWTGVCLLECALGYLPLVIQRVEQELISLCTVWASALIIHGLPCVLSNNLKNSNSKNLFKSY